MLVITLGSVASGSTWAFNVTRSLFARSRPDALSLSVAEANQLLDNLPMGRRDIIVKAHWLDKWLLTLASIFDAKIIVTTRDPRDSFVSQRERFGANLQEAVRDLGRSSATLAMIDKAIPLLAFRYEDRFMDRHETVAEIARFLEIPLSDDDRSEIYKAHLPENVTRKIDRWLSLGKLAGFEQSSHWHAGHVGDGECGKWRERLSQEDEASVMGAVGSDLSEFVTPQTLYWSPRLFTYHDERQGGASERLECTGEARSLLWGPYQYLPAGRWRVSPRISLASNGGPLSVRMDTFIPIEGRETVALRMVNLPVASPERLAMEFDHHDHLQDVEFRLSAVADGRSGTLEFGGVDLTWLGPSERTAVLAARPVSAA